MNQRGKVGFSGLLIILILVYGGYVAVVYISSGITESQIAKEIKDEIGFLRGGDFTPEKGKNAIIEILKKNKVIFEQEDEDAIEVVLSQKEIEYYFTYQLEMNFLLFKKIKVVETEDRMASYE